MVLEAEETLEEEAREAEVVLVELIIGMTEKEAKQVKEELVSGETILSLGQS